MKEYLNSHLDQIGNLISGLRDGVIDIEKLTELDRSLEMLSHWIKTVRLNDYGCEPALQYQGIRQDAAFYFDMDFRVIRLVGSFENIFGSHDDSDPPLVSSFFISEDFKFFKERTKILLQTKKQQSFDLKIISKNGLLLPVHFMLERISFFHGHDSVAAGMIFYQESPSDLKDYKEILLENLPGVDVYLFDTDLKHVLAGGREKERLKLTNADFSGKTLFEVFDEKICNRLFPFYRNALDGKVTEGEVRIKEYVYFISASPVYGIDKQVVGGALISQDVTKEKEIERNLIKAKKEAEEANRAKSLFLASMSHEIRTPLNAIIGFTGLLNKTDLSPKQKKFSLLIKKSSEHLLSVVNEILLLFKLGLGKVYIEQVPFNIIELVHNVHESLLFRTNEKKLSFKVMINETVPEIVIGDPFRIKQILINLVWNAIKYTDEGEVSINLLLEKETKKKVFLKFDFEDTGIGISKYEIDVIFQEFVQSGRGSEESRRGTGLGLTIVQKLVDLLNGRFYVESEKGRGSVFSVVIPFHRAQSKKTIPVPKNYEIETNLLEGKRILYADDDENNILLGESILSEWKADYEIAYDGSEALILLEKEIFDIVLLDIQMPKLSGIEVVKKIRRQKRNPNVNTKMLAVTANIMESEIKKYLSSGFDDFLIKPFSEEVLYNKICHLLDLDTKLKHPVIKKELRSKKPKGLSPFDTSLLLKTAGGDFAFFNNMIDTFIDNAKDIYECFTQFMKEGNWEGIGRRAHKAIPSFRYFRLDDLAADLGKLEYLGLNEKNYEPMKPLVQQILKKIDRIIDLARQAKI